MNKQYIRELTDMINKFDNLYKSMNEITVSWDANADIENVLDSVKGFPFESSFDEMTQQVGEWCFHVMDALKKEMLVHSIVTAVMDAEEVLNTMPSGMTNVYSEDISNAFETAYDEITKWSED